MLDRHFTDLDENHYKDVIKALEHRCTKGIMYKHDVHKHTMHLVRTSSRRLHRKTKKK